MGNQNTSGIVEDEKVTTSESPQNPRDSRAHDQEEQAENQAPIEEVEERRDSQEKAAENEVLEEHEGSANEDPETQSVDHLPNVSINHVEPNETCFEEEISDEMQDQVCTVKAEETQTSELVIMKITNQDSPSPLESANITTEPREDHDTSAKEQPVGNELIYEDETRSCPDQDTDHFMMIKSDDTDNEVEINSNHGSDKALQEDEYISSSDDTILEDTVVTTIKEQGQEQLISNDCENLGIGSSVPSYKGARVELRKFPSFDFGLNKPEESDHTPLLYNDNSGAIVRSFSSRSSSPALRFQNRSAQIERYEAVEDEEKTIRMERSNSESSTKAELSLNLPNNNSVSDQGNVTGLEGSPPSTKGSGKRKPKSSSLFTTCLCCTAVIN